MTRLKQSRRNSQPIADSFFEHDSVAIVGGSNSYNIGRAFLDSMVAAYFEGVKNGQKFRRSLTRLAVGKPVVVLKGGYTGAGAVAAASHTGSLAGSDESWDALLAQAGVVRVYNLDEMADDPGFDLMVLQVSISNSGWPGGDSPFRVWPQTFLDAASRVYHESRKPTAIMIHGTVTTTDFEVALNLRRKCYEAGLPVYDSIPRTALAMRRLRQFQCGRLS